VGVCCRDIGDAYLGGGEIVVIFGVVVFSERVGGVCLAGDRARNACLCRSSSACRFSPGCCTFDDVADPAARNSSCSPTHSSSLMPSSNVFLNRYSNLWPLSTSLTLSTVCCSHLLDAAFQVSRYNPGFPRLRSLMSVGAEEDSWKRGNVGTACGNRMGSALGLQGR